MKFSSLLIDDQLPLVIDTSVLINLYACNYGVPILSSIPNQIIVPEIVAEEFNRGISEQIFFLKSLVNTGIVVVSELTEVEYELFGNLTSNLKSIDDGEAATIAIATSRKFFPIIDERKGRARAIELVYMLEPGWSLDLFRHPHVITQLGSPADVDALYLALRKGRMRIPAERVEEVIELIGMSRAVECTCIPGYRERFKKVQFQI